MYFFLIKEKDLRDTYIFLFISDSLEVLRCRRNGSVLKHFIHFLDRFPTTIQFLYVVLFKILLNN